MYICISRHIDTHKKFALPAGHGKISLLVSKNSSVTSCCQNNIYVQSPRHSGEWRVFSLDPFDSDEVNAIHSSMGLSEVQFTDNRRDTVGIWCVVLVNDFVVIDGTGKKKTNPEVSISTFIHGSMDHCSHAVTCQNLVVTPLSTLNNNHQVSHYNSITL